MNAAELGISDPVGLRSVGLLAASVACRPAASTTPPGGGELLRNIIFNVS